MFKSNRKKFLAGIAAVVLVLSAFALTSTEANAGDKITICHCTSSATNPIQVIEVSVNAWEETLTGMKHGPHHTCLPESGLATDIELIGGMCGEVTPPE